MSKKGKLLTFTIIILFFTLGLFINYSTNIKNSSETVETEGKSKIEFHNLSNKGMKIAIFEEEMKFSYIPKDAPTLKEQAEANNYALAINASYFHGSYQDAQHAGLLQIDGELIAEEVEDKQLSAVVLYLHDSDSIAFGDVKVFNENYYNKQGVTFFQTGPIVIYENEIDNDSIENSINGAGMHKRTLLGYTDSGKKFFITTQRGYPLKDFAQELLSLEIFKNEVIYVVNLDGGPSTAGYSTINSDFNYNEDQQLPFVLYVK